MILFVWFISIYLLGILAAPIILGTFILMRQNESYGEMLLSFFFLQILADSLEIPMSSVPMIRNVSILLLGMFLIVDREKFRPKSEIFRYYIPFFIVAIICLYYAEKNMISAVQKTLSYILIVFVVPNYLLFGYREHGAEYLKKLIYIALGMICIGVAMKYVLPNVAISHGGRLRGVFGNPNGLGIFLILITTLFYIIQSRYESLFSKEETILILLVLAVVTYWSGSRNALTAILLFFLFIPLSRISPFIGVLLFISAAIFYQAIFDFMLQLIQVADLGEEMRVDTLEEGSGRLIAWKFAWDNIQKSFFLGKGISYDEFLMRENFDYLSRLGHEGGVHNSYLILWLNTGLIGLLAFFRGFFLMFIKAIKRDKLALPFMLAVLFSVMFEPWLASSLNPYTILFLTGLTILFQEEFYEENDEIEPDLNEELVPNIS